MPYSVRKKDCKQSSGKKGAYIVIKKKSGEKTSCHTSKEKAKSSINARYAESVIEEMLAEIKDYFRDQQDEDYLAFDGHPLSDVDSLLDPSKPAPWDHLTNDDDDGDVDVDIEEKLK